MIWATELQTPSLLRRMGSMLYDGLTLIALWLLMSALFTTFYGAAATGLPRLLLQGFSLLVISSYFLWCWTHGGQTLAMKTWRVRLVQENGVGLNMATAMKRYLVASAGLALGGVGLWWALFDRDLQFLHDRLSHTRLVLQEKSR